VALNTMKYIHTIPGKKVTCTTIHKLKEQKSSNAAGNAPNHPRTKKYNISKNEVILFFFDIS